MKRAFVLGVFPMWVMVACGLEAGETLPGETLEAVEQHVVVAYPTTPPIIVLPTDAGTTDAGTGCIPPTFPTMPTVWTTPTALSSWPSTRPFIPANSGSAYVSVFRDLTNPAQFVAYGFDVENSRLIFFVTGSRATELAPFTTALQSELMNLPVLTGSSGIGSATFYQADVPIPPRPTPGIHNPDLLRARYVWEMSVLAHRAHVEALDYAVKNGL